MDRKHPLCLAALLILMVLNGGCPTGITITLPDGTDVTADVALPAPAGDSDVVWVEVWNDTDYDVVPRIHYDDDTGYWERLVSAGTDLDTGDLRPGEFPEPYPIGCDRVGVIYSDTAGQFRPNGDIPIGQADPTRMLERGEDFECGDTIRFRFVGEWEGFGVLVYVNGVIVD